MSVLAWGSERINDVDCLGNASVVGLTRSSDFPTTADAIQSGLAGNSDGFITRLNATGMGLVFSTYLGGSDTDSLRSISVDPAGSVYVTGEIFSPDLPTTPGAFQTIFGGGSLTLLSPKSCFPASTFASKMTAMEIYSSSTRRPASTDLRSLMPAA